MKAQGSAVMGLHSGTPHIIYQNRFASTEMRGIGARWDKRNLYWYMPPLYANLRSLLRLYPDVELSATLRGMVNSSTSYTCKKIVEDYVPERILMKALPHQREGLRRAINTPFHGYFYELGKGLGKTFTSIALAEALKAKRVLVICVPNLFSNWQTEIYTWLGEESNIRHKQPSRPRERWNITNVESLGRHGYINEDWDLVIYDESVMLQHRGQTTDSEGNVVRKGTQRTTNVTKLRDHTDFMVMLSGSPISKHADGLYPQLHALYPNLFTSYWRFVDTYCLTEQTKWGTKITGTRSDIDFGEEFKDVIYRLATEEVFGKLTYNFETINVGLTDEQVQVYDDLMEEFEAELETGYISAVNKAARLVRFGEVISDLNNLGPEWPSISAKRDYLLQVLPKYETPAIIWTWWRKTAENLYQAMLDKGYSVGYRTGDNDSGDAIGKFKRGELDYIILSMGVGKYGHTFSARTMFYFDKWFDGDAYNQSLGRVTGRIGLENTKPTVVSLHCLYTVDDLVVDNLGGKMQSIASISNEDLIKLLAGLKRR